jgi:hypothetical protein
MICPKCNFDQPDGRYECFKCGVIFEKIKDHGKDGGSSIPDRVIPKPQAQVENKEGAIEFFKDLFLYVESDINVFYFGGRVLLFLVILISGLVFIFTPMEVYVGTAKRLMHLINLPFHEAGHVLFRPFGELMTGLGGSLMQLIVPLVCMMTFLIKTRDTFAASVSLWWLGESLMDLAPYINDARAMNMILIGGITGKDDPDMHDWHHLLRDLDMLKYDHTLAVTAHSIGIILMIITFMWGGYILFKQYKNLDL